MKNGWMIRAGNGGRYFDDFKDNDCVAIGWNSLGSVLTVFSLSDTVISEVQDRLAGKPAIQPTTADETQTAEAEFEVLREEVVSRGHELIKDKIQGLDPEEMEELTAALLRAMGYQTRVSARGPDRGVDILASPDGLGLTQPRIKAEVKHRSGSMGSLQPSDLYHQSIIVFPTMAKGVA